MYDPAKPNTSIVLEQMKKTWVTSKVRVLEGSPYPTIIRNFTLPVLEVGHTDGIGSKGIFHWQNRTFVNAALDALAMNLNDLVVARAKPYMMQNHITLPVDDTEATREIMTTLANECFIRDIAITGGETSIHDNYPGMEISITMHGWLENQYKNRFLEGDVLIGLASSGVHSNGFTLIRQLGVGINEGQLTRHELLTPTKIYDNIPFLPYMINGLVHITGGGFSKIKPRLNGVDAIIHRNHALDPQEIFFDIYKAGVIDLHMYKTFNCGIGFVLSVNSACVEEVISKTGGCVIGEVVKGTGQVTIFSKFSKTQVMV